MNISALKEAALAAFFFAASATSHAQSVTFEYLGEAIYNHVAGTPMNEKIQATITFSENAISQSNGQYFGYPQLSDVLSWEVHSDQFDLTSQTGRLTSSFPTPPFVIRANEMSFWSFGFITPSGATPVQDIWLTNRPAYGISYYDSIYMRGFPSIIGVSYSAGTWAMNSSVPEPSSGLLIVVGLLAARVGSLLFRAQNGSVA